VNFLFRTCVSQYAPQTTVSEHGEYFIEFFSSVRDICRRYSRFWPQVRVFLWAEKRGKKGNLGDEKLGNRFQSFRPIVHGNGEKIFNFLKFSINMWIFFFSLFCNFLTWRKGWQIYPLLLCCNKGSGKKYFILFYLFIYLFIYFAHRKSLCEYAEYEKIL